MSHLDHLPTASEQLLEQRTLLKRVDTKFIVHNRELPTLFGQLQPHDYSAARHTRGEYFRYENLYFDTSERYLLRDHHRGRRPRYKVRLRHHLSRKISFFELKEKRPNGTTSKVRVPVAYRTTTFGRAESDILLEKHHQPAALDEAMQIGFDRIMLVGIDTEERITVDTGLWFDDGIHKEHIENLAIIEVKQARFNARSPIMRALRTGRALQLRVSKYITGAQLLWPEIRLNRYNHRLRMLRRRIAL